MEETGKTERPALHGAADAQLVRAAHPAPAGRRMARAGDRAYDPTSTAASMSPCRGRAKWARAAGCSNWDRFADLKRIAVPTLVVSGKHDTMDPAHMAAMAKQLPQGELAVDQWRPHGDVRRPADLFRQADRLPAQVPLGALRCHPSRNRCGPAGDALLLAPRRRARLSRRDVLGDHRSRADDRPLADAHRRDQRAVRADERARADRPCGACRTRRNCR